MIRRILLIITTLNILFVGVAGVGLYLAETYPFSPQTRLFAVQSAAEQARLHLTPGKARQAAWALGLAERRLVDLARARDPTQMKVTLANFDAALTRALPYIEPLALTDALSQRFLRLLLQSQIVFAALEGDAEIGAVMAGLQQRVQELLALYAAEPATLGLQPVVSHALSQPLPIPFLGQDLPHESYPLKGMHAVTPCESCHQAGVYVGTPKTCTGCHSAPTAFFYPHHFEGNCDTCHTEIDWLPYDFDHLEVIECESCHREDAPKDHHVYTLRDDATYKALARFLLPAAATPEEWLAEYSVHQRLCSDCHIDTTNWLNYEFDHRDFKDCARCHQDKAPLKHYLGQCSRCHGTTSWKPVNFNHTGYSNCETCHTSNHAAYPLDCVDCHTTTTWKVRRVDHANLTDCLACHSDLLPAEHYLGPCSNCHTTEDWNRIIFSHAGLEDCRACHDYPEHYPNQCSYCHNTHNWAEVNFNHAGLGDCLSCHTPPTGHYAGQCSNCHTTRDWVPLTVDHSGMVNCASCHTAPAGHYAGQCSNCHNVLDWEQISFDHSDLVNCASCHTAPPSHYLGQCSNCHNVLDWEQINFDHTGLVNCESCHTRPADHWSGDCVLCHTTDSWQDLLVDHSATADCSACHLAPDGHWPGQCSRCHNVTSWEQVTFDHTNYTNCKACHQRPANHNRGQCSRCHTTDTWIIPPTLTPSPTSTPAPTQTPRPGPTKTPTPPAIEGQPSTPPVAPPEATHTPPPAITNTPPPP